MRVLKRFKEYRILLERESEHPILPKYDISEEEWDAMRAIPENPDTFEKYERYYSSEGAKDFVDKILDIVCDEIFQDPLEVKEFMSRLAKVESCYGTNPNTYSRPSYTKGLFQLDKNSSLRTIGYKGVTPKANSDIRKRLEDAKKKIKTKLGMDWNMVPYSSLAKPLYSALACRLFIEVKLKSYSYNQSTGVLTSKDHPIPKSLSEQAKWWKNRYNSQKGSGTEAKFKNPPGCSI
jgi:hypothetical protein